MKIFNSKRKRLLFKKNFQKYLLYAIGEIFLVVTGIIIGLQVNEYALENRNERETDKIFAQVIFDLKKDVEEIEKINEIYEDRKIFFDLVLAKNPDMAKLKDCEACQHLITSLKLATLNSKGARLLENKQTIPNNKKEIAEEINSFYVAVNARLPSLEKAIEESIWFNLEYLRDQTTWYADWVTHNQCNDLCRGFFENENFKFQNLAAHHQVLLYENYLPVLNNYKVSANKLIAIIERDD